MTRPAAPVRTEHLSSVANPVVKTLRSLDRKKARQETGLFLVEGARLAEEGLRRGWTPALVLANASAMDRPSSRDLLQRLAGAGAKVHTASDKVMEAVSRRDNPQTVIAAFRPQESSLTDLDASGPRRWIALFEIRDPGNLGTIIRTADAAGVDGVILIGHCCDPFSIEAVRATMGSLFCVPIVRCDAEAFLAWRVEHDARLVAASVNGPEGLDGVEYGERSILLLGNEQAGLTDALERACDELVRIPMRGAADSLNLSVAAGVMIYEVWRARGFSGSGVES